MMAEEKKPWFLTGDDEPDMDDDQPKFNADDMEFEAFMFDPGAGSGFRQSGPLDSTGATLAQPQSQTVQTAQAVAPFTGSEVPRRESGPLPRQSQPLLRDSGPLPRQSRPLTAPGGLEPTPQPTPMRASGPLVDGRTSTGPIPMHSPSTPRLSATTTDSLHQVMPQHSTNPFVAGIARSNTGPTASPDMGTGNQPATSSSPLLPGTGPLPGPATRSTGPMPPATAPQDIDIDPQQSGLMSRISDAPSVPQPPPTAIVAAAPEAWSDSDLASVEDFSAVLLALDDSSHYAPPSGSLYSELPEATDTTSPPIAFGAPWPTDPTLSEPEKSLMQAESAPNPAEIEAGGAFRAADLEFERFMFDQGAVTDGEAREQDTAVQQTPPQQKRESGPLPFWLQNTGDLEAPPVTEYMDMIGVATGGAGTSEADDHGAAEYTSIEDAYNDLYADLPPIEPFDFAAIKAPEVQAEPLGFSSGELSGFEMPERNTITATTDLQAVADLLGNDLDADATSQATTWGDAGAASTHDEHLGGASIPPGMAGWTTGMVTGDLSAMPDESATEQELGLEDMDVAPFNITDLDLENNEAATGYLAAAITGPLAAARGRRTGPLGGNRATGPIGAAQSTQQDDLDELTSNGRRWPTGWLGDRAGQDESFEPTEQPQSEAVLAPSQDQKSKAETKKRQIKASHSTHALTDVMPEEPDALAPDESYVEDTVLPQPFGEGSLQTAALHMDKDEVGEEVVETEPEPGSTEEGQAPRIESVEPLESVTPFSQTNEIGSELALPEPEVKMEMAQVQPAPLPATSAAQSVAFPTALLASGPLPEIEGFDQLQEMVTRNPDDLGAHIALAAAYAQMGDVVTELRVYRRILRKPTVSDNLIRLIAEELADCEDEMGGQPYFHQVRGDLYMKQGRFDEAIAEYNKLA